MTTVLGGIKRLPLTLTYQNFLFIQQGGNIRIVKQFETVIVQV